MKLKRFSLIFLVSILLVMQCNVMALERSSNYLDAYGVYLTPQSGGKIVITADIDALRPMTKIGVTVLHLYESSNGVDFHLVRTYRSGDYPEMMGTGMHFLKTLLPITVHLGIDILLTHFAMLGIKLDMTKKLTQVLLRRPLGNICFSEK